MKVDILKNNTVNIYQELVVFICNIPVLCNNRMIVAMVVGVCPFIVRSSTSAPSVFVLCL